MLKQIGSDNGDKGVQGNIPNLKLGEYRYYPQDNPNLKMVSRKRVSRRAFKRILKNCGPKYILSDVSESNFIDKAFYVGSIGTKATMKDGNYMYVPLVINKGYLCVKEATANEDGTVLYLHSGIVMVYKEQYIENNDDRI